MRINDIIHEWRIRRAMLNLLRYPTGANAARYNKMLRARSPEQVARMELERGLV